MNSFILYWQGGTMNKLLRKTAVLAICVVGLSLALSLPSYSQTRQLSGKVTNEKGEPIANAQVVIQKSESKQEIKVKTNKKGEYNCLVTGPGPYTVGVHATGYAPTYKDQVKAEIRELNENNFTLNEGQDTKLPMEMTDSELAVARQRQEKAEKQAPKIAEVQALVDEASALEKEGKYAEAAEKYKQALEKDNTQSAVHALLAEALIKQGKMDDALTEYNTAVTLRPNDAALLTNKGVLLSKMGKTAESQEAFKAAALANPAEGGKAYYNLGVTLINAGQVDQAVSAFKQAITADPNYAESYYQLGLSLSAKSDTIAEAIQMLKKYISMGTSANPENVEVSKQLISSLESSK
jgi:tetratricopeptide (TPR) repeat protein